jgi:hypothetical protein
MESGDLDVVAKLAGHLVRMHHCFDPQRFLQLADPEAGYARYFATECRTRRRSGSSPASASGPRCSS